MNFIHRYAIGTLLFSSCLLSQVRREASDPLFFYFDKQYGQVEVGGRFAGVEFHESRPLPSRISFYYPVANSIDVSTDYWKRSASQPIVVGIRVADQNKQWVGKEPWAYTLSPHKVTFESKTEHIAYEAVYEFCLNEPALVFTFTVKNISRRVLPVEVYTHLLIALRTCQTYARRDSSWTEFDSTFSVIAAHFDNRDTKEASIFVQNVGVNPKQWTSSAEELSVADDGTSDWISQKVSRLAGRLLSPGKKGKPVAAFVYNRILEPGQSMAIIQIIGSSHRNEVKKKTESLAASWEREVQAYDEFVRDKSLRENLFLTCEPWLDRSAAWARAILTANAHYLEGSIVPMPCPAEYNFFFTHDLLLTNLGAVNFDLGRVKKDLLYVASHSDNNIIPHAYYWKDDGFKTEFCTPSNWNHLWFILVAASYLRHSQDNSTLHGLFPLVTKSLEEVLTQRRQDNLMYAFRPDWWDIGWNEGPRAYFTILTIRALREYLFISSFLARQSLKLNEYEQLADSMEESLQERLWDRKAKYLINYNGVLKDSHYYIGSLLAPVFHVVDDLKATQLVETASRELVDSRIGVRNVAPADFHTDSSKSFFKFVDDEAGQPYVYANGGVWPHANAWYMLALQSVGKVNEALQFLKSTMTIDGITGSPLGQPAMYEYRYADASSADFGKIDKPSFLWAGGFYLYSIYSLLAMTDNVWNISVTTPRPTTVDSVRFSFAFGSRKDVSIHGSGIRLHDFNAGEERVPSLVLPLQTAGATNYSIEMGKQVFPYLKSVNAILYTARLEKNQRSLEFTVSSFKGHRVVAQMVLPKTPTKITLDGKQLDAEEAVRGMDGAVLVKIRFLGSDKVQKVSADF